VSRSAIQAMPAQQLCLLKQQCYWKMLPCHSHRHFQRSLTAVAQ
jgi:hypothetical protein